MRPEIWQQLSPLLDELLEMEDSARAQRLSALRTQDATLADELVRLMRLEDTHGDFLSEPAVPVIAGPTSQTQLGPYRLEHLLGEGGMGQVWLASRADGLYERRVALKLLRPGLANPNLRLRFTRERQILARLAHPHIARLLDAGIDADGQPYLALEYVDGEPITDWCRTRNAPLASRLRLFLQVCEAVSHAHANLIVHRDLKPSNILVTPLEDARLLDFGIAKLLDSGETALPDRTRTGVRAFTLHYAAPEQVRGEPVTTMTDVYALGVVLYELLTEACPYQLKRNSDAEWEEAILQADPLRPSQLLQRQADACADRDQRHALRRRARALAGDLDNIVLKALAKQPEQRYPSVEAFALDLHRYNAGKPVQARGRSAGYRLWKSIKRHRWAYATASMVCVVVGISLGIVLWQAQQALREARRAQALQDFVVSLFEEAGRSPDAGSVDMRTLLAAGAARGARELAQQPEARAELYGLIAKLQLGLGDMRQAQLLLQRQHSILQGLSNPPPALQLDAATQSARVQLLQGQAQACVAMLEPLQTLAQHQQGQHPTQSAAYYVQYGYCESAAGSPAHARILLRRALGLQHSQGDLAAANETRRALSALDASLIAETDTPR